MGYDILSDDLFDEGNSSSKGRRSRKRRENNFINFSNVYIHLVILLLIIIPLFIYFYSDFGSFLVSENEEDLFYLDLLGDLEDFNISYSGDVNFYSKRARLKTSFSEIGEEDVEFKIYNFSGRIFLFNDSIVLKGVSDEIDYKGNRIKLNGEDFVLSSFGKSVFNLNLSSIDLLFESGKFVLKDVLTFNMENSSVLVGSFNASISYDGKFSFSGVFNSLDLSSFNNNLVISFKN